MYRMKNEKIEDSRSWRGGVGQPRLEVRPRARDRAHVINGLLLTFNDKFRPGEEIMFGDVAGIVTQMGWFDTKIRLYSERTVVVPNGQIMGVPLVNFSRMRWGQYKTELRSRPAPKVDASARRPRVDCTGCAWRTSRASRRRSRT